MDEFEKKNKFKITSVSLIPIINSKSFIRYKLNDITLQEVYV